MSTGELDERRPAAERERALAYGAEFRLGALERVWRGRQMHRYTGLGVVFGGIAGVAGLPTLIGIDAGSYPGVTKAVVSAVVGAVFAGCVWLLAVGRSRTRLTSRLYRYSDGLAGPGQPAAERDLPARCAAPRGPAAQRDGHRPAPIRLTDSASPPPGPP